MEYYEYADVEVTHEEIHIHPAASRRKHSGDWFGEARIIGNVIINGKEYRFNYVIKVDFEQED